MRDLKRVLILLCSLILVSSLTAQAATKPAQQHDRDIIRFFVNHPKLAATPAGSRALWLVVAHVTTALRNLQTARRWPAHHSLWLCIHGGEGNWDDPNSGGNGHYGGLQMTPGWLGYFVGTANQYSQLQQEDFAEEGYRDSGYSHAWLEGQWGETIGPCWAYA